MLPLLKLKLRGMQVGRTFWRSGKERSHWVRLLQSRTRFNRWFFFGMSAILAFTVVVTSCTKVTQPLRVGGILWPGYESLYLARSLGYYPEGTVQLVDYPSSTELSRAYRNGDVEVAALTLDETLLLAETDPNVRIILVTDVSYGADVILAKPEIQRLQDIKGRRVGLESTGLGAYVITRALNQVQMSSQDIEIVSLSIAEHEAAFQQGLVDAVVTFEPVRSHLLAKGAKLLFDSTQIPGEIVDVLVVREEILRDRPDAVKALAQGWFRAIDYLKQNPQDAAKRMAPRENITPEEFLSMLKLLRIPDLKENQQLLGNRQSSLFQGAQKLSKTMLDNRLLKQAIEPSALFDASVVQDLR